MLFWNKAVFWWWGLAATAEKAAPLASETTETQQQPLKQRQRRLRNGLRKRALQLQREGAPLENDLLRLLLLCRLRPASQLQPQPLLLTLFCFLLETRELATAFRAPPQRCRSLLKLCSSLCSAFCIHKAYILVWFKTSGSSTTAKERILCCWNSLPNTVKLSEFSYLRKCKWTFLNCKKTFKSVKLHQVTNIVNLIIEDLLPSLWRR